MDWREKLEFIQENAPSSVIRRYDWKDDEDNITLDRFSFAEKVITQQSRCVMIDTQSWLCDIVKKDFVDIDVKMDSLVKRAVARLEHIVESRLYVKNIVLCSPIPGNYDKLAGDVENRAFSDDPMSVFPGAELNQFDEVVDVDFVVGEKINSARSKAIEMLCDDGMRMFLYSVFYYRFLNQTEAMIKEKFLGRDFVIVVSVPIFRTLTQNATTVSSVVPNVIRVKKGVVERSSQTSTFIYGPTGSMMCSVMKTIGKTMTANNATEIITEDADLLVHLLFFMSMRDVHQVYNANLFFSDHTIVCLDTAFGKLGFDKMCKGFYNIKKGLLPSVSEKNNIELDFLVKHGSIAWKIIRNMLNLSKYHGNGAFPSGNEWWTETLDVKNEYDMSTSYFRSKFAHDMEKEWKTSDTENTSDTEKKSARITVPIGEYGQFVPETHTIPHIMIECLVKGSYFYGADIKAPVFDKEVPCIFDAHKVAFLDRNVGGWREAMRNIMRSARVDAKYAGISDPSGMNIAPHVGLCIEYVYSESLSKANHDARRHILEEWPVYGNSVEDVLSHGDSGEGKPINICDTENANEYARVQLGLDLQVSLNKFKNTAWKHAMTKAWTSVVYWKIMHDIYCRHEIDIFSHLDIVGVTTRHHGAVFHTWLMAYYYHKQVDFAFAALASMYESEGKKGVDCRKGSRNSTRKVTFNVDTNVDTTERRGVDDGGEGEEEDEEDKDARSEIGPSDSASNVGDQEPGVEDESEHVDVMDNQESRMVVDVLNTCVPILDGITVCIDDRSHRIHVYFDGWTEYDVNLYVLFVLTRVYGARALDVIKGSGGAVTVGLTIEDHKYHLYFHRFVPRNKKSTN